MRKRLFALGAAASTAPLFLVACVSDDSAPAAADAGTPPSGQDATTFDVFVPPQSDAGADASDARPSDTGPGDDSSTTDAAETGGATTLFITALAAGEPASGVTIVFDDVTGALLGTATTDGSGVVNEAPPAGTSMVSALLSQGAVQTVMGVTLGDQLTFVDPNAMPATNGTITVNVPTFAGATGYELQAGTDDTGDQSGVSFQVSLTPDAFYPNGQFPMLVTALGSGAQTQQAFLYSKQNTFIDDSTYALSSAWTASFGNYPVDTTNLADAGAVPNVAVAEVTGGIRSAVLDPLGLDAGSGPVVYGTHPGFADSVQAEAELRGGGPNGQNCQAVASSTTANANGTTLDLSQMLPAITATNATQVDPKRPIVSWTSAGSLANATAVATRFDWFEQIDGGTISGSWLIVAPASVASTQAPALPASATAWTPTPGASVEASYVAAFSGSATPSYGAARQFSSAFALSPGYCQSWVSPPLPVTGALAISLWTPEAP